MRICAEYMDECKLDTFLSDDAPFESFLER